LFCTWSEVFKRTTCNRDWDRYNKLKSETQHQTRKSQTDVIQNTVNRH
jgi:hypothetical protein